MSTHHHVERVERTGEDRFAITTPADGTIEYHAETKLHVGSAEYRVFEALFGPTHAQTVGNLAPLLIELCTEAELRKRAWGAKCRVTEDGVVSSRPGGFVTLSTTRVIAALRRAVPTMDETRCAKKLSADFSDAKQKISYSSRNGIRWEVALHAIEIIEFAAPEWSREFRDAIEIMREFFPNDIMKTLPMDPRPCFSVILDRARYTNDQINQLILLWRHAPLDIRLLLPPDITDAEFVDELWEAGLANDPVDITVCQSETLASWLGTIIHRRGIDFPATDIFHTTRVGDENPAYEYFRIDHLPESAGYHAYLARVLPQSFDGLWKNANELLRVGRGRAVRAPRSTP